MIADGQEKHEEVGEEILEMTDKCCGMQTAAEATKT